MAGRNTTANIARNMVIPLTVAMCSATWDSRLWGSSWPYPPHRSSPLSRLVPPWTPEQLLGNLTPPCTTKLLPGASSSVVSKVSSKVSRSGPRRGFGDVLGADEAPIDPL
jgi:hypothetical protein